MNTEPTIPSAHTSEKAVISSILKDASLLKRAAADGLSSDSFHHPDTKTLWEACRELPASDNNQFDLIAVVQHLTDQDRLDRIGGASQVVECYSYAPTPAGWSQWVSTLKEYQARRLAQSAAREIATADDAAGAIESFRTTLQSLQQVVSGKQRSIDAEKAGQQFIETLLKDYNSGELPGASTGIAEIDEICGGMRPGEFWVIAGKPSRGKSVLMLQIASKFIADGKPVAIHSLEMAATHSASACADGARKRYERCLHTTSNSYLSFEYMRTHVTVARGMRFSSLSMTGGISGGISSVSSEGRLVR